MQSWVLADIIMDDWIAYAVAAGLAAFLLRYNYLRERRRRSLRRTDDGLYIWRETDGSGGSSGADPRYAWDTEDRGESSGGDGDADGDGDGGGGDGGGGGD